MKILQIPYIKQTNNLSCGAACLEMIYKYFGLNVSQEEIFEKYKTTDPHNPNGIRVLTKDLVIDAKSHGLVSGIIAADFSDIQSTINLLKIFLDSGVPLIACQQYSLVDPLTGHFRVLLGVDDEHVYLHDPDNFIENEEPQKLSYSKFFQLWQPTGENVTGGRLVWINKV